MGFSLVMELIMEEVKVKHKIYSTRNQFLYNIERTDTTDISIEDIDTKKASGHLSKNHNIKTKSHNKLIDRLREKVKKNNSK